MKKVLVITVLLMILGVSGVFVTNFAFDNDITVDPIEVKTTKTLAYQASTVVVKSPKLEKKIRATSRDNSKTLFSKNFIYDATLYKNKNPANEQFFIPIKLLYHHVSLFRTKENIIELDYLREVATKLPKSDIPYILDIEIWDVHTADDTEANRNIDRYILVIDTMKKARPDLKFGYYGVLPNRDYWSPVSNDPKKLAEWNHINQRLKRLVPYVDVICPSLYTFYDDIEGWKKYASENIKRAKEYGKPVYPFLWPQYHDSNKLRSGDYVGDRVWAEQLSLVSNESDGIIIWGGHKEVWDDQAQWWKVTKKFIIGE